MERRKRVLSEVARVTGMSAPIPGLLRLLLEKRRMRYLQSIVSVYHEMADEAMGRVRANVYAAIEPTSEEKKKIQERLARVTGKEVILETIQDTSLIGGMVAKIGGLVLDGSLRTQLARIRENLAKG
jgi:F-type H+-transporting ATPase subunit delta